FSRDWSSDVCSSDLATILNGARIGAGSLIAAGALVPENADISPGSLVAGVPGKVRRELREEEVEHIRANGRMYLDLARRHSAARSEERRVGHERRSR